MPADTLFVEVLAAETRVKEIEEIMLDRPDHPLMANFIQERKELKARLEHVLYGPLDDMTDAKRQARFGCAL